MINGRVYREEVYDVDKYVIVDKIVGDMKDQLSKALEDMKCMDVKVTINATNSEWRKT